jgi:hypothetical protein
VFPFLAGAEAMIQSVTGAGIIQIGAVNNPIEFELLRKIVLSTAFRRHLSHAGMNYI